MSFLKHSINVLKFSLLLLVLTQTTVYAITKESLNKETKKYVLKINYPQGFAEKKLNSQIKDYIESTKKGFFTDLAQHDAVSADAPGKSGLNIGYTVNYDKNNVLSIRFDQSIFHKGAAHPLNTVHVLNFILDKPVKLAELFKADSSYLPMISEISKRAITSKKISDSKWIEEGTKPTPENYRNWSFAPNGLEIIFDSYQVAAYVYGEQSVFIKLDDLKSALKPDVVKMVWKNNE